ncbi:MAG: hypothetical protein KAI57_01560 [Candidatus Pacebacteria bacterium]|nr:hypothetical protein [Candidatus Paceibacterota bacterium]
MKKNIYITENGFIAMATLLFFISMSLIIVFSLSTVVLMTNKIIKNSLASAQSYYTAESGLEDGILRLIKNYDYTAINSFSIDEDAQVNQNIIQTGNTASIKSVASYKNNERQVMAEMTITTSDISFHYGVQVGEGGLTMLNGSKIVGNLYSDGSVVGSGTITGDLVVATGMSLDANGLWDTYDDDRRFGKNGDPTDIAMSFSPASSVVLSQVSFFVKANGNPADGTVRIVEDNAGSPSTSVLATTTFLASKIGSSYGWVNLSFSSPASLIGGNTYWIIIDVNSSPSKYFYIGRGAGNSNSISKYSSDWSGSSWTTDALGDYEYKAWIGGLATKVEGLIIEGNAHAHDIIDATISGDARYQTISGSTVGGNSYPGEPDPPFVALPISDSNIDDWEAAAVGYGILNSSICTQSTDITIDGGVLDCDFEPAAGITITINGTLWVKGNINFGIDTELVLSSAYGDTSGVIIADKIGSEATSGKILVENNVVICGSQGINSGSCYPSVGSYLLLISTHSGVTTYAIDVRNNSDGAVFYAHKGTANINNNANLKEVTAHKLNLSNNAIVTYESGLANASFSSGPGGGWVVNSWNETQ